MTTTVAKILDVARTLLGTKQGSANHSAIVSKYNSITPLPVGYAVKPEDDWCDVFITFLAIETGATNIIGRECGVQRHIDIFNALGIWIEDGRITPKPGDIITFNWDQSYQNNDGWADHIGIVESVCGSQLTTIEGNVDREVQRRTYQVGNGYIRGYARPKYQMALTADKSNETIANEVIAGQWDNGMNRIEKLKSAGYDPFQIQVLVNEFLKPEIGR